jgi:uncharacterized protein
MRNELAVSNRAHLRFWSRRFGLLGALRGAIPGLVAALLLMSGLCSAGSFDCNSEAASVEERICPEQSFSQLYEKVTKIYQEALRSASDPEALKREQANWLGELRNMCKDCVCLVNEYRNRLAVLEQLLPTIPEQFLGKWTASGRGLGEYYGDLEVKKTSLSFTAQGSYTFVVLAVFDDSVVLEMPKYFKGHGRYIRLGPIIQSSSNPEDRLLVGCLNFAVYRKKNVALGPKRIQPGTHQMGLSYPGYTVWGLYSP